MQTWRSDIGGKKSDYIFALITINLVNASILSPENLLWSFFAATARRCRSRHHSEN